MKRIYETAISLVTIALMSAGCSFFAPDPCKPPQITETVRKLDTIQRKFADSFKTASTTARIGLAPVLLNMQEAKREAEAFEVPSCAAETKTQLVNYMNLAINTMSDFASQKPDSDVSAGFDLTASAFMSYSVSAVTLAPDLFPTPSPTP